MIAHHRLLLVFINALVTAGGVPLPVFPVLLMAGALTTSVASFLNLLGVATCGTVLADLALYFASMRAGRPILTLICRFTLSPDSCVRRTEDTFGRLGNWALPLAKFVPGFGPVAIALSGITQMRFGRFLVLDTVGAAFYVALPIALGELFKNAVSDVLATLMRLGAYGVALVVTGYALYIGLRWMERTAFARRLRMDRLSVTELAAMIKGGQKPIILDVRDAESRARDGIIPGAIAAHKSDLTALLRAYSRDVEVVIYCACPNEASAATAALHLKRAGYRRIRPLLGGIEAWTKAGGALEFPVAVATPVKAVAVS